MIRGFDINYDRLNVVVISSSGDVAAVKTYWYSETVSHGFPREKAKWVRLNALSDALEWCGRVGVDYVVFKGLTRIRFRGFTSNPYANCKITEFPKKQTPVHGAVKALKLGFTVVLVNPGGTSSSVTHKQIMREKGLGRHTASAYIIAYRGLKLIRNHKSKQNLAKPSSLAPGLVLV